MSNGTAYQQAYWNELFRQKTHIFYLEEYLGRTQLITFWINAFMSLTTSVGIAGWSIWQTYSVIWAVIIGASQVITAFKPFLPYKDRLKALPALLGDLDRIYGSMEERWFDVQRGNLNDRQINEALSRIGRERAVAIQKHLASGFLPRKRDLLERAEENAEEYFSNRFPQEG